MQTKRMTFTGSRVLPYLLLAPQVIITLIFFVWPASQALWQSMLRQDPFGLRTTFVWFRNFERLFDALFGAIRDQQPRAFLGETQRGRAADAASRPRHDRRFSRNPSRHLFLRFSRRIARHRIG